MQTIMWTLEEYWKRQWLADGRAEGNAKMLIRLAEQRFGPRPQGVRARIANTDAVSIAQRGDRRLSATSLETLSDTIDGGRV
jgi:hypothetical protein